MCKTNPVVLVVEDHPLIRMTAVDLVLFAGYQALEASDAGKAIALLETRADIALVFTDVQMPGPMDGVRLAHYVRNRWPPVKLLVVSGRATLPKAALPAGSGYFAKPYDGTAVTDAIARLLSGVAA